jgi:hypothetical protein
MVPIETGDKSTSAHRGRAWRDRPDGRSPQQRAITEARELEFRRRRLLAIVHSDSHEGGSEGPAEVIRRAGSQVPEGAWLPVHPGCENWCDIGVHARDYCRARALGANSDKTGTPMNVVGQRYRLTRTKDARLRTALHGCGVRVGVGGSADSTKRNAIKALPALSESLRRHHLTRDSPPVQFPCRRALCCLLASPSRDVLSSAQSSVSLHALWAYTRSSRCA